MAMSLIIAAQNVNEPVRAADSIPTTEKLDLRKVSFEVDAQPEFKDRLYSLSLKQFKEAGLSPLEPERTGEKSAVLRLMLKPESLHELCPGKVLYEPSLALTEDVIVERTAEAIKDSTWSSKQAPHVRAPLTIKEIEEDSGEFISRFIVNYKMGNPAVSPQKDRRQKDRLMEKAAPSRSSGENISHEKVVPGSMEASPTNASLRGLKLETVNFLLSAGASYAPLYARAVASASKEGLRLAFRPNANTPQTLTLRLASRPLDEMCPGKVLYEASVELVEQVKIKRNPHIYIWTDTWSKDKTQITDHVSDRQLEADLDELLGQFITTFKSDNSTGP
ncbi:MAG: hypothetical protein ACREI9_03220 [Nitrospiraceae bacterium]